MEERTKEFMSLAADVRAWDAVLVNNGEKVCQTSCPSAIQWLIRSVCSQISELYSALQATEPTQQKITGSLDYVEGQQKELGLILDQYENSVNEILGNDAQLSGMGGADGERERA